MNGIIMLQNKEISAKFQLLGQLMELHGENSFKAKSYETAAFRLKKMDAPLYGMTEQERSALPGIGAGIQAKIAEMLDRGSMAALDELLAKTPTGVVDMLRIKGLGAKKVGSIWRELEVEGLGELLYACQENRLAMLKGFGAKTQAQVIENIEFLESQSGFYHFATLEETAQTILKALRTLCPRAEETGALRRRAIVLSQLEFVVVWEHEDETEKNGLPGLLQDTGTFDELTVTKEMLWLGEGDKEQVPIERINAKTKDGVPVSILIARADQADAVWFQTSGSEAHRKALRPEIDFLAGDETAIYASIGLNWIAPERREGHDEITQAAAGPMPKLLELADLSGAVHNHSTWSDGGATIEAMAAECIRMGLEYLVMSDHSRTAVYAGGLSIERVEAQGREIDQLNAKLAPFKIFKSIESDILADGSLDYPDDVLAQFDLVIASVHSGLKMDEAKATERLLRAIANPYTTVLGHPTGRLLLSRPGYPIDHARIIQACAAHNVVLELNANPWRLDVDWQWIPQARKAGVFVSINPDAHALGGLHDMHYGVLAARKGGLTAAGTFNAMNLAQFEEWLNHRKANRP